MCKIKHVYEKVKRKHIQIIYGSDKKCICIQVIYYIGYNNIKIANYLNRPRGISFTDVYVSIISLNKTQLT